VPDDHCHGLDGAVPVQGGPLYRFPIPTLLTLSVAIVPLGIAKAAIAAFTALSEKTRAGTTNPFRDRELIQDSVGRAEALRRAAKALVLSALDELEDAFDLGGRPLIEARANFRLAITFSAESCLKAVEMMVNCAGAAAIFDSSPLSRQFRDIQAATKHVAVAPHLFALGGRIAMGMDPGLARF
jgi:indole-3-acetate monooxygenase